MGTVGPLRNSGSCLWFVQAGAAGSEHHGGPQLGQVGSCTAAKAPGDWTADGLQPHQVPLRAQSVGYLVCFHLLFCRFACLRECLLHQS